MTPAPFPFDFVFSGCEASRAFRVLGDIMRTSTKLCRALLLSAVAGFIAVPASAGIEFTDGGANAQRDFAVTYQINPAHSGSIKLTGFTTPLTKRWSVNLGSSLSYAVIADGLVFVNASNDVTYALKLATGATRWSKTSGGGLLGPAYDNGSLFLVTGGGLMSALSARNGAQQWSAQMPGQYSFSSAPMAVNGQVFTGGAGSGGTVYAVDEKTGTVKWTQSVANGDDSSPAYGDNGIYVSYPCQYYKFDPKTGSPLWHDSTGCDGGGGDTPAYFGGDVYIQDWTSGNYVFNANTGAQAGTFGANNGDTPAFLAEGKTRGLGYSLSQGTLYAWKTTTETNVWSFTGDGQLSTMPIVINAMVVEGSGSGNVYALDAKSGAQLWTDQTASGVTSLAAGQGTLIVVSGNVVTAYGP
jgi:outer membrane protein assembly factor BamB